MTNLRVLVGIVAFGLCAGAAPQTPPTDGPLAVGQLGPSPEVWLGGGQRRACRVELAQSPSPLTLFEITRSAGGRTCFKEGRVVVFMPEREGQCPHAERLAVHRLTWEGEQEAFQEFRSCLAGSAPSDSGRALIYRPLGPKEVDATSWLQFEVDSGALVSNAGLPATRYAASSKEVCFEGPDLDAIEREVREADLIETDAATIERVGESCAERMRHIFLD